MAIKSDLVSLQNVQQKRKYLDFLDHYLRRYLINRYKNADLKRQNFRNKHHENGKHSSSDKKL